MSSSATILIRAEALDQIAAHPEQFVRELVAALRGLHLGDRPYTEIEAGNFANAAMVLPVAHDSLPRVILSHDGMLNDFSYASVATYARAGRFEHLWPRRFRDPVGLRQRARHGRGRNPRKLGDLADVGPPHRYTRCRLERP